MSQYFLLGLNSAGFNTSSSLLVDGEPIFACEEERLVRDKRTRRFPAAGIRAALDFAGLEMEDIEAIAIGWNPAVNLEGFNLPQSQRARYLGELFYSIPSNLMNLTPGRNAEYSRQTISFSDRKDLDIHYVMHHQAHAASFFFSPFEEASIVTIDAFGEKQCIMFCSGKGNKIEVLWSQEFPHSLGSFYSAMTAYLGFAPQGDEWKLMGASAYGDANSVYYKRLRSLVSFHDGGGFELDLSCFNHFQFHRPGYFTDKMADVIGLPPLQPGAALSNAHYDMAAAAQRLFEDIYFHLINSLHAMSPSDNLVLSGGSTLNSLANGKVCENTPFTNCFIPPVPDDAGTGIGAAFFVQHQIMDRPRGYVMKQNYLGPGYSDAEIAASLDKWKIGYETVQNPAGEAAQMIADGKILGWFQGRLEFGDRALGNRSIIADPRQESMKDKVNETVKYREGFRPFAPAILADHTDDYFIGASPTPFMEKVFPIRPEKQAEIPAVTHNDGTGRLQTVTREHNPMFADLISAFYELSGVPIVLNTSFNLKGEAMVCSPHDAVRTFYSSGLDALVIGNCVVRKSGGAR